MKRTRQWTTLEMGLVKMGLRPIGRSFDACKMFCARHGIIFKGKKEMAYNENLIDELDRKYSKRKGNRTEE